MFGRMADKEQVRREDSTKEMPDLELDKLKLGQVLSQYGDIERIWLTPEDPAAHVHRKKAGGFRGQGY
ncbi:hypothetical protein E3N88_37092 [Mikania micrantha]|uniref:Uncharacterized protein n=1 Tax=Mikania micrantha TaxID=192012 RepID=A0A5N6M635_9ASTR|nr:hypothetical protein E3N88_37092 [Mikania micrantha]